MDLIAHTPTTFNAAGDALQNGYCLLHQRSSIQINARALVIHLHYCETSNLLVSIWPRNNDEIPITTTTSMASMASIASVTLMTFVASTASVHQIPIHTMT